MKFSKHISIIILNWNGIEETRNCIKSLLKSNGVRSEILIIDNGSRNNEAKTLRNEYKDKLSVVSLPENLGFTGGVNFGIQYAKTNYKPDYYLLLNNDTEVDQSFLKNLILETEKSGAGLANPLIFDYSSRNKLWYGGGKINWIFAKPYHLTSINQSNTKLDYQTYLTGCALLIKKDVVEKIGLLDDRFFAYFEDAAYSLTARKAGFKCILARSSHIYHIQAASTGKKSKINTYLVARNRILFVNNYTSLLYRVYFMLFNFLKLILVIIVFAITNQGDRLKAYTRGYIDGTIGKGGAPELNKL